MPDGLELKSDIANLLPLEIDFAVRARKGDQRILDALRRLVEGGWGDNDFIHKAREVAEAMELAQSIDTFLESHQEDRQFVQLGKLGIVRAIALKEATSKMMTRRDSGQPLRLPDLADTWYYSLAHQLFSGVPASQPGLAFQNVSFIVFNYDRCLPIFLKRAAEVYFRLSPEQANKLIRRVQFIHPYGWIGSPYQGEEGYVPFGCANADLIPAAERIKTFSEQGVETAEITSILYNAETVIFLGFGFHDQNMRVLDIGRVVDNRAPPKRVYATTLGLSPSDQSVVREQIAYALSDRPSSEGLPIHLLDGKCVDLFSYYWRSLTA